MRRDQEEKAKREQDEMERLRKVEEDRINQLKLLEHQKMEDELERQIEETRKANMQLRIQQELKRLQEQVVFAISRHYPYKYLF